MENNTELRMAWQLVEKTGCNVFLTGKAGTGKTTFLRELRERSPKRMVVLAPTGIAAINAGGATIHSFFQLPLSPYVPGATFGSREQKRYQFGKVKRSIIKTLDLLVIDEISMVRADLLDAVDSVMRRYRVHNLPFGGVQLLLIGDLQQLAPVVKDEEWEMMRQYYDTPYFFSSRALMAAQYQTIELQRVYRQQDSTFIGLLNSIRENRADEKTLEALNRRCIPGFTPPRGSDYIQLTTHNWQAQRINDNELEMLPAAAHSYRAEVEGMFPESSYPADETLVLKEGAQVMFIKNDPAGHYYNGMLGDVAYADGRKIRVRTKDTGETIDLEPAEWANSKYAIDSRTKEITETVEGVFRQYPLRLAWAITIHKSQGLTFEHAIIDASHSFAHGQTYVALSRCKSLEGMVLSAPLSRAAVISDATVDEFTRQAGANRPTEATVTALEQAYVVQMLDELFGLGMLRQAVEMMVRTLMEHFYSKYHTLLTEYDKALKQLDALTGVAARFGQQYRAMLAANPDAADAAMQERIHKAAGYFAEQLRPVQALFTKTRVETGNKTVRAQSDDRLAQLGEELALKAKLFDYESRPGTAFATGDYLRRKAMILLGNEDAAAPAKERTRKAKEQKPPKEPKIPTHRISHDMFISGMTIEQIAAERQRAVSTIFGHLAMYVEEGTLPIDQIVPQERIDTIRNYARTHPDKVSAAEIKEAVDNAISYQEITLVKKIYAIG
ncbi:MAG: helix-turn-helix domain-containing protein [Prevotella sp.]|nr:helix-turn-helix domain-containing protein [Prevotella sp.]